MVATPGSRRAKPFFPMSGRGSLSVGLDGSRDKNMAYLLSWLGSCRASNGKQSLKEEGKVPPHTTPTPELPQTT